MSLRIYGNRALQTLPGLQARPTSSRVREALFNILQGQIEGSRWLDLCAGVGTIGAEVLCRGASSVVGIERSPQACQVIIANWNRVAAPDQFQVIRGDAVRSLSRSSLQDPFDFIYFDPPYESDLYGKLMPLLSGPLATTGIVIVEHDLGQNLPDYTTGLQRIDQRRYGKTQLSFYERSTENEVTQ